MAAKKTALARADCSTIKRKLLYKLLILIYNGSQALKEAFAQVHFNLRSFYTLIHI